MDVGFIDLFLHLDKHLEAVVQAWGVWVYVLLFVIIFAETGLIVTPILPGDSLLFVAGAIAAVGGMSLPILLISLMVAAIVGNTVNYSVGRWLGPRFLPGKIHVGLTEVHLIKPMLFTKNTAP